MDASAEQTDAASFGPLEPISDGFRNYRAGGEQFMAPEEALVDRAQLLNLSEPEMTVLVGTACVSLGPMRKDRRTASSQPSPASSPTTSS